jgi:hypothetical protein
MPSDCITHSTPSGVSLVMHEYMHNREGLPAALAGASEVKDPRRQQSESQSQMSKSTASRTPLVGAFSDA